MVTIEIPTQIAKEVTSRAYTVVSPSGDIGLILDKDRNRRLLGVKATTVSKSAWTCTVRTNSTTAQHDDKSN